MTASTPAISAAHSRSRRTVMLLWAALGFVAGWLMNVVSDALPEDQPLGLPACPQCGTPRTPDQWSGLVAYLLRRERCRTCARRIAWRWPLVEAAATLACAALFYLLGPTPQLAIVTLYTLILMLICI